MVDQRIKQLKRHLEADPGDTQAQVELIQAQARLQGPSAYLSVFNDRSVWNQCGDSLQDRAIDKVKELLAPEFVWLETRTYQCGGLSHRIASFWHPGIVEILNLIPGGSYQMGSDTGVKEIDKRLGPKHWVTVAPFLIGRFAVRQSVWDAVEGPDYEEEIDEEDLEEDDPELPRNLVSWNNIKEWIDCTGDKFRLPSEAEWEYACRAGSTTAYCFGNEISSEKVNFYPETLRNESGKPTVGNKLVKVGSLPPNSFGLYEVHGNLWEFCEDAWFETHEGKPPNSSAPRSNPRAVHRVVRGGAQNQAPMGCRSVSRAKVPADFANTITGFRLARSLIL